MQPSSFRAAQRRAPYTVAQPRQIAALAVPVRQSIVDAVAASGPSTIAQLAAQIGRPANGLYHHVSALVRVGLLLALDSSPGSAGRPAALYDVPGRPLRIHYKPEVAATRNPMQKVVGAMTRLAAREFADGYRDGVRISGAKRELWASRAEAWLTDAQLARANVLLQELVDLFANARGPAVPTSKLRALTFILTPEPVR